jgi:hypothetical protein
MFLTNAEANAIFDATKIIVSAGVLAAAAIVYTVNENDINTLLLIKQGIIQYILKFHKYKSKNSMNKVLSMLFMASTVTAMFIPTMLAYSFPIINQVTQMSGPVMTVLATDPTALSSPFDASGVQSYTNLTQMIGSLICNTTTTCITNTQQNGLLLDETTVQLTQVPISSCIAPYQEWCLVNGTWNPVQTVLLGGQPRSLAAQGSWSSYYQYASISNASAVPGYDMLSNGIYLNSGLGNSTYGIQLSNSLKLMENTVKIMSGVELASDFIAVSYRYVNNDTVSIVSERYEVKQYEITSVNVLGQVTSPFFANGSCSALYNMYGNQAYQYEQTSTTSSGINLYFYQDFRLLNGIASMDACYLSIASDYTFITSINQTDIMYEAQISGQSPIIQSIYGSGDININTTSMDYDSLYATGTVLIAERSNYTGGAIMHSAGILPEVESRLARDLGSMDIQLPTQLMTYARYGGIYLSGNLIKIEPALQTSVTFIVTIVAVNSVFIILVIKSWMTWRVRYLNTPIEQIIASTAHPDQKTCSDLSAVVYIGVKYDNRGKHITLTSRGHTLCTVENNSLLDGLPKNSEGYYGYKS